MHQARTVDDEQPFQLPPAPGFFSELLHSGERQRSVMLQLKRLHAFAGTHLALKHGAGFVRLVFIAVVSALILKTGYDAFLR